MIATSKVSAKLNLLAAEELSEALPSFGQMENILEALDRRGNILGMFFTNVFALSDFFTIRKFRRWQDSYAEKTELWLNTVSSVDASIVAGVTTMVITKSLVYSLKTTTEFYTNFKNSQITWIFGRIRKGIPPTSEE